jgi:hypothetical protein
MELIDRIQFDRKMNGVIGTLIAILGEPPPVIWEFIDTGDNIKGGWFNGTDYSKEAHDEKLHNTRD